MKIYLLFISIFVVLQTFGANVAGVLLMDGQEIPAISARQIEFRVGFDHKVSVYQKRKDQWPINIYASWKNISRKTVRILLKDHDAYHGQMVYPYGIRVRIYDSEMNCLTSNTQYSDGWWDSSCLGATLSKLMPGDIITLKPGESVIRSFHLDDVLMGLTFSQAAETAPIVDGVVDMTQVEVHDFRLPVGESIIEVSLSDLEAVNRLTYIVEEENK